MPTYTWSTSFFRRVSIKMVWIKSHFSLRLRSLLSFSFQVEPLFCEWIKKNIPNWKEFVVVAPDEGSTKRCTSVANDLNLEFAMINNRKPKNKSHKNHHRRKRKKSSTHSLRSQKSSERELEPSESDTKEFPQDFLPENSSHPKHYLGRRHVVPGLNREISVAGSVKGRDVILIDDMIDTGQTLKEAIEVSNIVFLVFAYLFNCHFRKFESSKKMYFNTVSYKKRPYLSYVVS